MGLDDNYITTSSPRDLFFFQRSNFFHFFNLLLMLSVLDWEQPERRKEVPMSIRPGFSAARHPIAGFKAKIMD